MVALLCKRSLGVISLNMGMYSTIYLDHELSLKVRKKKKKKKDER
jgi:preprotein translocase subunit SecF